LGRPCDLVYNTNSRGITGRICRRSGAARVRLIHSSVVITKTTNWSGDTAAVSTVGQIVIEGGREMRVPVPIVDGQPAVLRWILWATRFVTEYALIVLEFAGRRCQFRIETSERAWRSAAFKWQWLVSGQARKHRIGANPLQFAANTVAHVVEVLRHTKFRAYRRANK